MSLDGDTGAPRPQTGRVADLRKALEERCGGTVRAVLNDKPETQVKIRSLYSDVPKDGRPEVARQVEQGVADVVRATGLQNVSPGTFMSSSPVTFGPATDHVLHMFEERGLLARSVQAHRPALFPLNFTKPGGHNLSGVPRQAYSLIHPTIGQPLFQMSPVDANGRPVDPRTLEVASQGANRGFALLFDWSATWDRIIDVALADASSGGAFTSETLPTEKRRVEDMMGKFRADLAKADRGVNNEVRTIGINNAALIGFLFAPSVPSALNECKPTWGDTKRLFQGYLDTVKSASGNNPVTALEFPVFTYTLTTSGMTLNPLDLLKPAG